MFRWIMDFYSRSWNVSIIPGFPQASPFAIMFYQVSPSSANFQTFHHVETIHHLPLFSRTWARFRISTIFTIFHHDSPFSPCFTMFHHFHHIHHVPPFPPFPIAPTVIHHLWPLLTISTISTMPTKFHPLPPRS